MAKKIEELTLRELAEEQLRETRKQTKLQKKILKKLKQIREEMF